MCAIDKSKTSNRFSPERRARALHMVMGNKTPIKRNLRRSLRLLQKIGCILEKWRLWARRREKDSRAQDGLSRTERGRIKVLEPVTRQLRQANEILRMAPAYFAQAEPRKR